MKTLIECFGWCGAGAILLAYALVSFSILEPTSTSYQLLNIVGGAGIIIDAFSKKDFQPVVLNVVWIVIALVSIATSFAS